MYVFPPYEQYSKFPTHTTICCPLWKGICLFLHSIVALIRQKFLLTSLGPAASCVGKSNNCYLVLLRTTPPSTLGTHYFPHDPNARMTYSNAICFSPYCACLWVGTIPALTIRRDFQQNPFFVLQKTLMRYPNLESIKKLPKRTERAVFLEI